MLNKALFNDENHDIFRTTADYLTSSDSYALLLIIYPTQQQNAYYLIKAIFASQDITTYQLQKRLIDKQLIKPALYNTPNEFLQANYQALKFAIVNNNPMDTNYLFNLVNNLNNMTEITAECKLEFQNKWIDYFTIGIEQNHLINYITSHSSMELIYLLEKLFSIADQQQRKLLKYSNNNEPGLAEIILLIASANHANDYSRNKFNKIKTALKFSFNMIINRGQLNRNQSIFYWHKYYGSHISYMVCMKNMPIKLKHNTVQQLIIIYTKLYEQYQQIYYFQKYPDIPIYIANLFARLASQIKLTNNAYQQIISILFKLLDSYFFTHIKAAINAIGQVIIAECDRNYHRSQQIILCLFKSPKQFIQLVNYLLFPDSDIRITILNLFKQLMQYQLLTREQRQLIIDKVIYNIKHYNYYQEEHTTIAVIDFLSTASIMANTYISFQKTWLFLINGLFNSNIDSKHYEFYLVAIGTICQHQPLVDSVTKLNLINTLSKQLNQMPEHVSQEKIKLIITLAKIIASKKDTIQCYKPFIQLLETNFTHPSTLIFITNIQAYMILHPNATHYSNALSDSLKALIMERTKPILKYHFVSTQDKISLIRAMILFNTVNIPFEITLFNTELHSAIILTLLGQNVQFNSYYRGFNIFVQILIKLMQQANQLIRKIEQIDFTVANLSNNSFFSTKFILDCRTMITNHHTQLKRTQPIMSLYDRWLILRKLDNYLELSTSGKHCVFIMIWLYHQEQHALTRATRMMIRTLRREIYYYIIQSNHHTKIVSQYMDTIHMFSRQRQFFITELAIGLNECMMNQYQKKNAKIEAILSALYPENIISDPNYLSINIHSKNMQLHLSNPVP